MADKSKQMKVMLGVGHLFVNNHLNVESATFDPIVKKIIDDHGADLISMVEKTTETSIEALRKYEEKLDEQLKEAGQTPKLKAHFGHLDKITRGDMDEFLKTTEQSVVFLKLKRKMLDESADVLALEQVKKICEFSKKTSTPVPALPRVLQHLNFVDPLQHAAGGGGAVVRTGGARLGGGDVDFRIGGIGAGRPAGARVGRGRGGRGRGGFGMAPAFEVGALGDEGEEEVEEEVEEEEEVPLQDLELNGPQGGVHG